MTEYFQCRLTKYSGRFVVRSRVFGLDSVRLGIDRPDQGIKTRKVSHFQLKLTRSIADFATLVGYT